MVEKLRGVRDKINEALIQHLRMIESLESGDTGL